MTMSDYNSDEQPILSETSRTHDQQQPETTTHGHSLSLSGFDIPSSDLGLDSIISKSESNPEKWAELDFQF